MIGMTRRRSGKEMILGVSTLLILISSLPETHPTKFHQKTGALPVRNEPSKVFCERKMEECLSKPGNVVSRDIRATPRECNDLINARFYCAPVRNIERVQSHRRGGQRWRVKGQRNRSQGEFKPSLAKIEMIPANATTPSPNATNSNIQIDLDAILQNKKEQAQANIISALLGSSPL